VTSDPGGLATFGVSVVTWDGWSGRLVFEGAVNGIAYESCPVTNPVTGEVVTSATGDGIFIFPCAGYMRLRVRASEYTSGTALVTLRGSVAPHTGSIPLSDSQLRASPIPVEVTSVEEQLNLLRRLVEEIVVDKELVDIVKRMVSSDSLRIDTGVAASLTVDYSITDLDTAAATQYFGYVNKGGNWYIMQLTGTTARYIKGDTGYSGNWTNRASLTYGYFYEVF